MINLIFVTIKINQILYPPLLNTLNTANNI